MRSTGSQLFCSAAIRQSYSSCVDSERLDVYRIIIIIHEWWVGWLVAPKRGGGGGGTSEKLNELLLCYFYWFFYIHLFYLDCYTTTAVVMCWRRHPRWLCTCAFVYKYGRLLLESEEFLQLIMLERCKWLWFKYVTQSRAFLRGNSAV